MKYKFGFWPFSDIIKYICLAYIKLNFIQPEDFNDCNGTIASATNRYQKIYDLFIANSGIYVEKMEVREVKIRVKKCEIWPSLEMNEKYELRVRETH